MGTMSAEHVVPWLKSPASPHRDSFLADAKMHGAPHFLLGVDLRYLFFDHANSAHGTVQVQKLVLRDRLQLFDLSIKFIDRDKTQPPCLPRSLVHPWKGAGVP